MSVVTRVRLAFGRKRLPRSIHPEQWPERSGRLRVLIENPDRADLWAHADLLREAGHDVAMCGGPIAGTEHAPWSQPTEHQERMLCPLVSEGHCPLVEGADVVVSTTSLTDSREILASLSARNAPALVIEGTNSELKQNSATIGNAVQIEHPIMPRQLVEAVERARSTHATDVLTD